MEKRCDEWIPVVCQHQHNMHFTPSDANSLSSSVSSRLSAAQLNRTEKQPFEMNTQTHNSLNSLWMNDYINFYHFSSFNSLVLYIIWFGCDVSSPTHSLYVLLLILFCPKINMIINITSKVSGPWNSMKFPIFSTRFNTLFASNATYSTLAQMPGQWNHERGGWVDDFILFPSIHLLSSFSLLIHSYSDCSHGVGGRRWNMVGIGTCWMIFRVEWMGGEKWTVYDGMVVVLLNECGMMAALKIIRR